MIVFALFDVDLRSTTGGGGGATTKCFSSISPGTRSGSTNESNNDRTLFNVNCCVLESLLSLSLLTLLLFVSLSSSSWACLFFDVGVAIDDVVVVDDIVAVAVEDICDSSCSVMLCKRRRFAPETNSCVSIDSICFLHSFRSTSFSCCETIK